MFDNSTRFILAAVYGAIEEGPTHVLMEIAKGDLTLAQRAAAVAADFDREFNQRLGSSKITTGSIGGEYVLNKLPEELEPHTPEQDDYCEYAWLIPSDLDKHASQVIENWRAGDIRWPSSGLSLQCSAEGIHAEVAAKYDADTHVWTRDLSKIFDALRSDFDTPELSTAPEVEEGL